MNVADIKTSLDNSGHSAITKLLKSAIVSRFANYRLRTKLMIALMGAVIISVSIVSMFNNTVLSNQLKHDEGRNLQNLAEIKAQAVGAFLAKQVDTLEALSVNKALQEDLERIYTLYDANADQSRVQAELALLESAWQSAGPTHPIVRNVLTGPMATELLRYRNKFPDNIEVLVTDCYGVLAAATNPTEHYYFGDDEWWQVAYKDGRGDLFIGNMGPERKIVVAVPVYGRTSQVVVGILRTTLDLNVLLDVLLYDETGQQGHVDLFLPDEDSLFFVKPNNLVEVHNALDMIASLHQLRRSEASFFEFTYRSEPSLVSQAAVTSFDPGARVKIAELNWHVVASQPRTDVLRSVKTIWINTFVVGLFVLVIVGVLAFLMAELLARPIGRLTGAVRQLGRGNLAVRAPIHSTDETGVLAETFNRMAERLLQSFGAITRHAEMLQTSSEVARAVTVSLELDVVLRTAAELICERLGFYYASIFTIDADSSIAILREAASEEGQILKAHKHQLFVGSRSLVGMATATKEPCIAQDVELEQNHLKNPLLAATRAEAAIPMIVGDTVVGALDVQSKHPNTFTSDMVALLSTLADQIAIAVKHARLYQEQRDLAEHLAEVDRLKTEFLTTMSHELRTPLNAIIGFAQVILDGIDGPINQMQREDLNVIHQSSLHLLRIINNILDLSKIEAGKVMLSFQEIDLRETIASVIASSTGLLENKPVELINKVPEYLPIVWIDNVRIHQVLYNLISNAIKFTKSGTVTISAAYDYKWVTVRVSDTGIGIPANRFEQIFEEFTQVDGSVSREYGGTGLGLPISKKLVELHGGEIWVESEPKVGSTFSFKLPVKNLRQEETEAFSELMEQVTVS